MKLALFLFAMFISAITHAVDFEVTAGITDFDKADNGIWHQEEFPNSIRDESFTGSVGITTHGFGLGYKYLGYGASDALATASDVNYANWRNGDAELWPLSTWHGRGYVHGVYLTYTHAFDSGVFLGGGAWAYRVRWGVAIPDWRPVVNEDHTEFGEPRPLQVGEQIDKVSWTAHIGYRFGDAFLRYEVWEVNGGEWRPIFEGKAQSVVLGYTF